MSDSDSKPKRVDPPKYDPDEEAYRVPPLPDTEPKSWEMDAHIVECVFGLDGKVKRKRVRRYKSRAAAESQLTTMSAKRRAASEWTAPMREAGGLDWFATSTDWDVLMDPPILGQYIPLQPGPATRQLYWADYFAMSAKAFEAYHHNPVAKRAIDGITEFVLGRGVRWRFDDPVMQDRWEEWWELEGMDERLEVIQGDLSTFGEVFLRWGISAKSGRRKFPTVRSIDPATIYEIVTDAEDIEDVIYYHQQFQTRTIQIGSESPTKYIIRQIPAEEIDHYKVNYRSAEVRGRSDLFTVLGWLKRLKDLLTSEVLRSDMLSRLVWHLRVQGDQGDLEEVMDSVFPSGRPPEPGSVVGTNTDAEIAALGWGSSSSTSQGITATADSLLRIISLGTGVPARYLAVEGSGTRADALVATEPGAKRFERRQRLMERMLTKMAHRVCGEGVEVEFIFPSIVTEDRSAKLGDLEKSEEQEWISHETAAAMAARELEITTYDYDDEQKKIDGEREEKMERAAEMIDSGSDQDTDDDQESGEDQEPKARGGIPASQNPLSPSNSVRKEAKESRSPGEEFLRGLLVEAVAAGRKMPRRTSDDAGFSEDVSAFTDDTHENLDRLRSKHFPDGSPTFPADG